jgi:hypothetical protein
MEKNLIYFTLSGNVQYLKLLELCIDSLVKTGYDGDILFLTNMRYEIEKVINYSGNVFYMNIESNSNTESSSSKLKIYDFENLKEYDKVIFCDIDTLWLMSPNILFNKITEDKFYVADDNHTKFLMTHKMKYYGSHLFNEEETEYINKHKIKGFSAGFFGFKTTLIEDLKKIHTYHLNFDIESKTAEQSAFNYYTFKYNLYNNSFNNLVSHGGYKQKIFAGVVIHFPGGIGHFEGKYERMINFKNKNIK